LRPFRHFGPPSVAPIAIGHKGSVKVRISLLPSTLSTSFSFQYCDRPDRFHVNEALIRAGTPPANPVFPPLAYSLRIRLPTLLVTKPVRTFPTPHAGAWRSDGTQQGETLPIKAFIPTPSTPARQLGVFLSSSWQEVAFLPSNLLSH